jgi:hypothetical protein
MKTWLAIMTAGSLLVAYTMNNDNGIGSKLVELKSDIVAYNAERAYASTNDTVDTKSGTAFNVHRWVYIPTTHGRH